MLFYLLKLEKNHLVASELTIFSEPKYTVCVRVCAERMNNRSECVGSFSYDIDVCFIHRFYTCDCVKSFSA